MGTQDQVGSFNARVEQLSDADLRREFVAAYYKLVGYFRAETSHGLFEEASVRFETCKAEVLRRGGIWG